MAAPNSAEGNLNPQSPTPRFKLIPDEDLTAFITSTDSANTKKQVKYGMSVFQEFCNELNTTYEDIENAALDKLLSQFYAGARSKTGELYSLKSMQAIRFALQHHFLVSRNIDIVKGEDFSLSNKTFKALMVKLKQHGKASMKHHPPISENDMKCIQTSLDLSTAQGLQAKVFLDTMLYFANRGMENLCDMRPGDFILHQENDKEFFTLRDMGTENHPNDDQTSQGGQMHALPNNSRCPVAALKKYTSKLNPQCQHMWCPKG